MSEPTQPFDCAQDRLAAELLQADASTREALLRSADRGALEQAVSVLGHTRQSTAAEVLDQIDQLVTDRALRKAARRELHRLRSAGIAPPERTAPEPPPATHPAHRAELTQAWATGIDPTGTRALWLLAERALGGAWLGAAMLNDLEGLVELELIETTRKRFLRQLDEQRRSEQAAWIQLLPTYALALVREGVDLAHDRAAGVPKKYPSFREVFGEADAGPNRALVYETISPVEATFNPDWLEQSPALLSEQEIAGWHVSVASDFRTRALEAARAPLGGLLVPGHTPEQQALQLVSDVASQALTPSVRHGFKRRLEETAYLFLTTDRLLAARRAVAAARALEDEKLSVERHPLMRLLVASGLARLLGAEALGSRRAGEVLIELVERAAEQSQSSPVETRPSGLILPR
jgi:hypothetical protein